MTYARYFAIKSGTDITVTRTIPGAVDLDFTLLGREKGGLCGSASATIPANFPNDYGITVGDFVLIGWDASNHWYHGLVDYVERGGPGSTLLRLEAVGLEEQLKSIYPRVNYGADPGNPYGTYDNASLTGVDTVVESLVDTYLQGAIRGYGSENKDIDATAAGTDIVFLSYDGSVSLYDILCSLAERTGFSWGFHPTSVSLTAHQFFFKGFAGVYDPNATKFTYGTQLLNLKVVDSRERIVNGLNVAGANVPKLGIPFSRRYVDSGYRSTYGPREITKRVPGIRRSADARIHAKAILDRRRNPNTSYGCMVLARTEDVIYPGQTKIQICDEYGSIFNKKTSQFYTYEIKVTPTASTLLCEFVLDEPEERPHERIKNTLGGIGLIPYLEENYTLGGTFQESVSPRLRETRLMTMVVGSIVILDNGDGTGTVQVVDEPGAIDDKDDYAETYTGIGIPEGTQVGDTLDVTQYYQDGELLDVTATAPGGGESSINELAVQRIVRKGLADGTIPIYNSTVVRDLKDFAPPSNDHGSLEASDATYKNAKVGHIVRVPLENTAALASTSYAANSSDYNAVIETFPVEANKAQAALFGRVLGITNTGALGMGAVSGERTIVYVKTANGTTLPCYLVAATDLTLGSLAAPLATVERGNA